MIQFLVPLGLFAVALASGGESAAPAPTGSAKTPYAPSATGSITWHDGRGAKLTNAQREDNYRAVYQMGKALERAGLFGPGFAEWLTVVSRTEAMGNPAAGSDAFSNAARGMYGLRPTTAWNEAATVDGVDRVWDETDAELAFANGVVSGDEVRALKDLAWSTALAAHNVSRLRRYLKPEQPLTMLGARRGWAFPTLVDDYDNSQRPELLTRWNEALAHFGYPSSFGTERLQVLVPRSDFPHPAAIRQIILDAIEGKDVDYHNQPGFISGSIEWGDHQPGSGFIYGWVLGQQVAGPWSWAVNKSSDTNPDVPLVEEFGETQSRNQAAQSIINQVEAWEGSA